MATPKTTQKASVPYGFPEIEAQPAIPLPKSGGSMRTPYGFLESVVEPQQQVLQSRPSAPDVNYYPSQTPAMDAFYEGAMSPPVKKPNSMLRMVGTGLLSALQGSTGPESRKPVYNAAGKVIGSREAGFWESLGNKPFDVDEASHIANIPHDIDVENYERQMKGLGAAAKIEADYPSKQALAAQRNASAASTPQRTEILRQEAARKQQLADLKLSDKELEILKSENRITEQEYRDLAALNRVQVQGDIRSGHIAQQGDIRSGQIAQQGDIRSGQIEQQGDIRSGQIAQQGAIANERAQMGGATIGTIPDPANPGQTVGVWFNPRTQKMERVQLDGQNLPQAPTRPGIDKPGAGQETPQDIARMEAMRTRTAETITALQGLIDEKGNLRPEYQGAVGGSRLYNAPFGYTRPGGSTREADIEINNIRANMLMGLISEMKSQSKTGATGFGQLAVKEVEKLESAASKLDPNLGEAKFAAEVKRLIDKLNLVMLPANKPITVNTPTNKPAETREQRAQRLRNQYAR